MEAKTKAKYEARAKIIKAMAHPSRLYMVDLLNERDMCVCELTEKVGADMSTVSKHLSLLKGAGIVTDEKHGTQVFYSLSVPCVLKFLGCIEELIKDAALKQIELIG